MHLYVFVVGFPCIWCPMTDDVLWMHGDIGWVGGLYYVNVFA